jgi:hypothetical protein
MFDWIPLIGDMSLASQALWIIAASIVVFAVAIRVATYRDPNYSLIAGAGMYAVFGSILTGAFAVCALAVAGIAAIVPENPEDPSGWTIDYNPPGKSMKADISPGLETLDYFVGGTETVLGDTVSDPDEFASRAGVTTQPERQEGAARVQLLGKRQENSFEVRAFRIKVSNPMPPRVYSERMLRIARKDVNKDYRWSRSIRANQGTRPPLSFGVELSDLESYQVGNRRSIRSYWVSGNPMFAVEGLSQERTWQSGYLRQPVQLSRGQQYSMVVVYEETEFCWVVGLFSNREECFPYSRTISRLPIMID